MPCLEEVRRKCAILDSPGKIDQRVECYAFGLSLSHVSKEISALFDVDSLTYQSRGSASTGYEYPTRVNGWKCYSLWVMFYGDALSASDGPARVEGNFDRFAWSCHRFSYRSVETSCMVTSIFLGPTPKLLQWSETRSLLPLFLTAFYVWNTLASHIQISALTSRVHISILPSSFLDALTLIEMGARSLCSIDTKIYPL